MSHTTDRDHGPVYEHEGGLTAVLTDGSETSGDMSAQPERVAGWRAACACGWRGQFRPRTDTSSTAPGGVDGGDDAAHREWSRHLQHILVHATGV